MFDESLLDVIVCPQCKSSLLSANNCLICEVCKLQYPIEDDLPILLVDCAEQF